MSKLHLKRRLNMGFFKELIDVIKDRMTPEGTKIN
jgi:hypothetical protein